MIRRLAGSGGPTLLVGAILGSTVAFLVGPLFRPLFAPPTGGIGWATVNGYPKGWDYALLAILALGSAAGALAAGMLGRRRSRPRRPPLPPPAVIPASAVATAALLVGVVGFLVQDHPYQPIDPFHDGEHLTPASVLLAGGRPHRDVLPFHGVFADGLLDRIVLGDPPSPVRVRRAWALLGGATLALLVPVAREMAATPAGMVAATVAGLAALGVGQATVFPWFRLAPLLGAAWALAIHARNRRALPLLLALLAGSLGVIWSLDTGSYAFAAAISWLAADRWILGPLARRWETDSPPAGETDSRGTTPVPKETPGSVLVLLVTAPLAALLAVLLLLRVDLGAFLIDSFRVIPGSHDAVWSLAAPPIPRLLDFADPRAFVRWIDSEPARYFLPAAFWGFVGALALRAAARGDRAAAGVRLAAALIGLTALRSAGGRVSWSHTRFSAALLGIGLIAFVVEPAFRRIGPKDGRFVLRVAGALLAAILVIPFVELAPAGRGVASKLSGWRARQSPGDLVEPRIPRGKGVWLPPSMAADLEALAELIADATPPGGAILDLSGEVALPYLLARPPATRALQVPALSAPLLTLEALASLAARPPAAVVLEGIPSLSTFDGVPNRARAPEIFAWAESRFRRRIRAGRFLVALPPKP